MEYKEVEEGNNTYLISSNGDIYRKLKLNKDKSGYSVIHLGGKYFPVQKVHRLVAEAFIPNPNNWPCVNHKDENPFNNCVDNLEWCTNEYNLSYGTCRQRAAITRSKPVVQCDADTHEMLCYFLNAKEASQQFPVLENARKRICEVCNDLENVRFHSAYGYWWRYATDKEIKEHHIK